MTIRRVVPNVESADPGASRAFYVDVLGFEVAMDLGWVVTFASPENPTAQISVVHNATAGATGPPPDVTIEVADVDATHARALAHGLEVIYPLTDESWGVRRFFVRDPDRKLVNIMSHRMDA
jgi:catechol 2,3-dioxygenase-like lactoylglutathione lyase family enzyme